MAGVFWLPRGALLVATIVSLASEASAGLASSQRTQPHLQLRAAAATTASKTDSASETVEVKSTSETVEAKSDSIKIIFGMLFREWKELPEKVGFVENCTATVSKILPQLRKEYTARNVPGILDHECDTFRVATKFQVNGSKLETAKRQCRTCARHLGNEFMKPNKTGNYTAWCDEVHDHLEREANMLNMTSDAERFRKERDDIKAELQELKRQHESNNYTAPRHLNGTSATHEEPAKNTEIGWHMGELRDLTKAPNLTSVSPHDRHEVCCPAGCRICEL